MWSWIVNSVLIWRSYPSPGIPYFSLFSVLYKTTCCESLGSGKTIASASCPLCGTSANLIGSSSLFAASAAANYQLTTIGAHESPNKPVFHSQSSGIFLWKPRIHWGFLIPQHFPQQLLKVTQGMAKLLKNLKLSDLSIHNFNYFLLLTLFHWNNSHIISIKRRIIEDSACSIDKLYKYMCQGPK